MAHKVDRSVAGNIARRNVCRDCHGKLFVKYAPDWQSKIVCVNCGEDYTGWVSKEYLAWLQNQQAQEADEFLSNYKNYTSNRRE